MMCTSCADACSAEQMDMRQCIRSCLDCADVCDATAKVAVRRFARKNARATIMRIANSARRCALNVRRIAGRRFPRCNDCGQLKARLGAASDAAQLKANRDFGAFARKFLRDTAASDAAHDTTRPRKEEHK
jgi:hypothetical protein